MNNECSCESCQFKEFPAEWEYQGNSYCIFHLPVEMKLQWSESQISEFVEIFHGSLGSYKNYKGAHFVGNVLLSPAFVVDLMEYVECVFGSDLDISTVVPTNFTGSRFLRKVQVLAPISNVGFRCCRFDDEISIKLKPYTGGVAAGMQQREMTLSDVDYSTSIFRGEVDFGYSVLNRVSFEGAVFDKAPIFEGAKLSNSISFFGVKFNSHGVNDEPTYRYLRKAMSDISSRDDEALFFVQEQRCKRSRHQWGVSGIVSFVYDQASEYGCSYERALMRLLYFQGVFLLWYWVIATQARLLSIDLDGFGSLLKFTLSQVFRPFELLSFKYQLPSVFSTMNYFDRLMLYSGAITHSTLTLVLFSLLLLALRWRFKRG